VPSTWEDAESHRAHQEAPDGRIQIARREATEQVAEAVEAAGVEEADEAATDSDEGEPGQLEGMAQSRGVHVAEDRCVTLEGAEHRVGDDQGDDGRDQRPDLDVVAVDDLGGEYRPPERRLEDGADPRPDAHRDRDAAILW